VAARLLAVLALVALAACERKPPPPPKPVSAGSVKIIGLKPETTTPLKVGAKVKVQVEVAYRLIAESGAVVLVVQAGDKSIAQAAQALTQGEGKAALAVEFVVPETNALQIYTPLQALGQKATATLDQRTYKVIPSK
jgi:hypothetical protein